MQARRNPNLARYEPLPDPKPLPDSNPCRLRTLVEFEPLAICVYVTRCAKVYCLFVPPCLPAPEAPMSVHGQSQSVRAERFDRVDPVWQRLREEAEDVTRREGELGGFIYAAVLNHGSLESAVAHRVAARLHHDAVPGDLIAQAFADAIEANPEIGAAFRADMMAVTDRDPACQRLL